MKKVEIIENIIIVLNFAQEHKQYRLDVLDALEKFNIVWSLSNERMKRKLNRISRIKLMDVMHDVVEAIY